MVKHSLELHKLNLKVMVRLIMVSNQVVHSLKKGSQASAVVLFFLQEFFLREDLQKIHQPITRLSAQRLRIRCNVRNHSNDALVNGFQQARAIVNELIDRQEHEVRIGTIKLGDVQLDFEGVWLVQIHCQLSRRTHCQKQEDAQIHEV